MFPRHYWISSLLNEWRDLNRHLKTKENHKKKSPTSCTASAFKGQPFKKCIFSNTAALEEILWSKKIYESSEEREMNVCHFTLVL